MRYNFRPCSLKTCFLDRSRSRAASGGGTFGYNAVTDFNDFLLLEANFGQSAFGAAAASDAEYAAVMQITTAAEVPEPTAAWIAVAAAYALRRRREP